MRVNLQRNYFSEKEKVFLELNELSISLFKYETGVEAVTIKNKLGYIVVLPYLGSVIWDAFFHGRSLKMKTSFDFPIPTNIFGQTYGCYLMHCGMTSMGVPKAGDNHPTHGDLPFADMKESWLEIGENEHGNYIEIKSLYEKNIAFDEHYYAIPSVKIYENSSILEVNIFAKNLSRLQMNLMYLCHINNKVVDDAKIYQTLDWDQKHMAIQPLPLNPSDELSILHAKLKEKPILSSCLKSGEDYDPEICLFLRNMKRDENNYSHFLYVLPDGSADYTYFDSTVLEHGVRWIAYHENCHSMGLVLPGTAESEGFSAELKKNNMRYLNPGEIFEATVYCGSLEKGDTELVKEKIEKVNQK